MSAKLLHALTDENPDLQKQIGCMTGIFQLFDRHHILTTKRIASHSPRKPPSGSSHFGNGNLGHESHNARNLPTHDKEKNLNKSINDNQRISTESSRASFSSSSCSSSFSSVECNKIAQPPEVQSFDQTIMQSRETTTSRESHAHHYRPNATPDQVARQSPDFRDVVKDSIYREARSLSVKTNAKEETAHRPMKHRDSPRPFQMSKSVDESFELELSMKQNLKDSLRVLAKLREAPQYFEDARESPVSSYGARDVTLFSSVPKDAPRFSYDGRDIRRSSFESRDSFKSTTRLKDLPRLSLDSRESSIKDSKLNSKPDLVLKDFNVGTHDFNRNLSTKPESDCHKRNPSVVAKLMGLEAMPKANMADAEQPVGLSKTHTSEKTNERIQSTTSCSPRNLSKEPVSPRTRGPALGVKSVSSSRVPIEPAPWSHHLGSSRGLQKTTWKNNETTLRAVNTSPSVYAEIEKRLKDLEFKQSDKDLRALKQILDAMHAKGLLETRREDEKAFLSERNSENLNQTMVDRNPRLTNRQSPIQASPISFKTKRSTTNTTPRAFDSPIVIMKPAKLVEKSGILASSVIPIEGLVGLHRHREGHSTSSKRVSANNLIAKDLTPKLSLRVPSGGALGTSDKKVNNRTVRSMPNSTRSQQLSKEQNSTSGRSSGNLSPRLQQKKLELEKRSRPPTPTNSLDLSKPRRQSVKQQIESSSPGGRRRPKSPNKPQSDDQLSEISTETRHSIHQGEEISVQSDCNISLMSQMDEEVTSSDRSAEMNCTFSRQGSCSSQSRKFIDNASSISTQKKTPMTLNQDEAVAEFASVAPEQPSPVSVLDASFYKDDLPSPKGKIEDCFKGNEARSCSESLSKTGWKPVEIDCSSGIARADHSSEMSRKKLENVENLVKKLKRLNSSHDEATTDYIASLCENTNPDHRYISEILLASGLLLRDIGSSLTTVQLHPSGHPINPDLFLVLEQTKASNEHSVKLKFDKDKVHRKLVFDAVNEILERKLASLAPSPELWLRADKLAEKTPNAQQLLRELCLEIDEQLQASKAFEDYSEDGEIWNTILFKDVVHKSDNWTEFPKEVSGIVLEVERSIFKELVDEVVSGEAMLLRAKPSRQCRQQLFAK